jgi:hypothetical protein
LQNNAGAHLDLNQREQNGAGLAAAGGHPLELKDKPKGDHTALLNAAMLCRVEQ